MPRWLRARAFRFGSAGARSGARRVAEFGDVWNPLGFTVVNDAYKAAHATELSGKPLPTSGTTPEKLASDLALVNRMAADSGRDLSGLKVGSAPPRSASQLDWLRQYAEAGATGFVYSAPGNTPEECIKNIDDYAAEVIGTL